MLIFGSHTPAVTVHVERLPVPGETVLGWDMCELADGGKGSNQAVAAARLGAAVAFVGCVGTDSAGKRAEALLRSEGVDCAGLRRSDTLPTGGGVTLLDKSGIPAMVSTMGANAEVSVEQLVQAVERSGSPRVFLTQLEVPNQVVLDGLGVLKRLGATTVLNPAPLTPDYPVDRDIGDLVDILVPNEFEAKALIGVDPDTDVVDEELARQVQAVTGVACVLLTLGARGFIGLDRNDTWATRPAPVTTIDTSGAGDVFCAALTVELSHGASVRQASRLACVAATLSVARKGTIPSFPARAQLDNAVGRKPVYRGGSGITMAHDGPHPKPEAKENGTW